MKNEAGPASISWVSRDIWLRARDFVRRKPRRRPKWRISRKSRTILRSRRCRPSRRRCACASRNRRASHRYPGSFAHWWQGRALHWWAGPRSYALAYDWRTFGATRWPGTQVGRGGGRGRKTGEVCAPPSICIPGTGAPRAGNPGSFARVRAQCAPLVCKGPAHSPL